MYDLKYFLHEMAKAGIRVLEPHGEGGRRLPGAAAAAAGRSGVGVGILVRTGGGRNASGRVRCVHSQAVDGHTPQQRCRSPTHMLGPDPHAYIACPGVALSQPLPPAHPPRPAEAPLPSAYTEVSLGSLGANVSGALNTSYSHVQHLAVDCPLFKVSERGCRSVCL